MKKHWYDKLHEKIATSAIKKQETRADVERWKNYIAKFEEPQNNIERSFLRYKCRMYYFSTSKRLIFNILGLGAMLPELFYVLTAKPSKAIPEKGLAVVERARDIPDCKDIMPDIGQEYKKVVFIDNFDKKFAPLSREARSILLKCFRAHPLQFFYLYFVYMELATHSHIILKYNPEAGYVYINERNIASPLITELYEKSGRKFCSFMHGEYKLQLIMAFMKFSKYYVWDPSYIRMFAEDLRCQIGAYVVYTPGKLKKKWHLEEIEPKYFCTYYFSGESDASVLKIAELFRELEKRGKKCCVRPHPRNLLHRQLLEKSFQNTSIPIENAKEISLMDSLGSTNYVVGLQSTVLSEAYAEGKTIVLDDVSDPENFELLKLQKFNVFSMKHLLLSELLAQAGIGQNAGPGAGMPEL